MSFDINNNFKALHLAGKGFYLNNLEFLEIHKSFKKENIVTLNTQLNLDYNPIYSAII